MKKYGLVFKISMVLALFLIVSCQEVTEESTEQDSAKKVERTSESVAVGVFKGNGAHPMLVQETVQALEIDNGLVVVTLTAADVVNSELQNIDVLIFPGGSAKQMLLDLNDAGVKVVKQFVAERGKGVVGICGGSVLLSNTKELKGLGIADVSVADPELNGPGHGMIVFTLSESGAAVFPELDGEEPLVMRYYNGPLFNNKGANGLAQIQTDVFQKEEHKGLTPGKMLLANGKSGKGKYFLSVGHPESTRGMRWMLPRMVRWVADKQIVSYQGSVVRPEAVGHELVFTPEMEKQEYQLYAQLFNTDKSERMAAIDALEKMNSWSAHEWIVGLLRDTETDVRLRAAKYLADHECTQALADLKIALDKEKDSAVASELNQYYLLLEGIVGR